MEAKAIKMLSIEKCKQILTKNGASYTDEEVKRIRELLYRVGQLDYQLFKEQQKKNEQSNHLHQGFHGRTG